MHDPMVVAFEIRRPWPQSSSGWANSDKRFEWRRHGPWWKPGSWSPFMRAFGRTWYWPSVVTVWHVEPDGRDSGTVCKHWADGKPKRAWRWHVWHWHLQISPLQKLRRWIFERCELCGRRYPYGYAPIAHQWDRKRDGHWWNITAGAYHRECSSLVSARHTIDQDAEAIRHLVAQVRVHTDETEAEYVDRECSHRSAMPFLVKKRVEAALGWKYDSNSDRLVKSETTA